MSRGYLFYIIQKGQVKITKVVNDNEVMLAVLNPGDIFGEMAILENKPGSASAVAFVVWLLLLLIRQTLSPW